MPKLVPELSDIAVRRLTYSTIKGDPRIPESRRKNRVGMPCTALHAVGGVSGLLLQCRPPTNENSPIGARSWILRTMIGGKRTDIGLGGYPDVTLSMARAKAREIKAKVRDGIDPTAERKALRAAIAASRASAVTFRELAKEYIAKKSKEFKKSSAAKQRRKLEMHLESYAYPYIGNLVVGDIERAHIVKMLEPIWETKTETASRLRMSVERILDLAGVKGLRSGDNPARWTGNLALSFPAKEKVAQVNHFAALSVAELPIFMKKLRSANGVGARALEFLILTACRSGEVRKAARIEIDSDMKTWIIPAGRMMGREHRVPLTDVSINLLSELPSFSEYLFPNRNGDPVSDVMLGKVIRQLGYKVTSHGFRSTFKDWATEHTEFADEISELALAHVNNDKTRAAYARSDALDKRRKLMEMWTNYCYRDVMQ